LELGGEHGSDPVLRAKFNWCLGLELDAQMLCFSQTLQGLTDSWRFMMRNVVILLVKMLVMLELWGNYRKF
jgi:hypothetical protein